MQSCNQRRGRLVPTGKASLGMTNLVLGWRIFFFVRLKRLFYEWCPPFRKVL